LSVIMRLGFRPCFCNKAGEKPLGGLGIAAGLDDVVEHIAILIDRPPQPMLPAGDRYHDLVEMPDMQIPRSSRPLFRDEAGRDSDMMPATIPR
jgi:hypothetical protein